MERFPNPASSRPDGHFNVASVGLPTAFVRFSSLNKLGRSIEPRSVSPCSDAWRLAINKAAEMPFPETSPTAMPTRPSGNDQ